MKFASLNDLYLQQLKDLHSAESQLIKALPKMAKAARNPDLKNASRPLIRAFQKGSIWENTKRETSYHDCHDTDRKGGLCSR
jgi:hypothetical protein